MFSVGVKWEHWPEMISLKSKFFDDVFILADFVVRCEPNSFGQPIPGQCSHFIHPENVEDFLVFSGGKNWKID